MNNFTLSAIGNLARNPEVVAKEDVTYTQFRLIGTDYAGKDDVGVVREVITSVWFKAFGAIGESIYHHARKGDQLFVESRVQSSTPTDTEGNKQGDLTFVVTGFRFGAHGKVRRKSPTKQPPAKNGE